MLLISIQNVNVHFLIIDKLVSLIKLKICMCCVLILFGKKIGQRVTFPEYKEEE